MENLPSINPGLRNFATISNLVPGVDKGKRLPNFNDGFTCGGPDIGAHERGTPAMKFGVEAAPRLNN